MKLLHPESVMDLGPSTLRLLYTEAFLYWNHGMLRHHHAEGALMLGHFTMKLLNAETL
jgi:hypothetical protein